MEKDISKNIQKEFSIDSFGNLRYWSVISKRYFVLEAARVITDRSLMIGKVGQQNILPNHLTLKTKDLELTQINDEEGRKIGRRIAPGISGFVYFGTEDSKQNNLSQISLSGMSKEPTPKNRLYITQVSDIFEAGWIPYYAPLIDKNYPIRNPFHVIICPGSVCRTGRIVDASDQEKEKLCKAFVRWTGK